MEYLTIPLFATLAVLPFYFPELWFLSLFAFLPFFANRSFKAFTLFGLTYSLLLLLPFIKAFKLTTGVWYLTLLAFSVVVFSFFLLQFGITYLLSRLGVFLPLAFTFAELIRTYFPFSGFPYFILGTLFAEIPLLKLDLSFLTIYGGSFLILFINYLLYKLFENWESKGRYLITSAVLFLILLVPAVYKAGTLKIPHYGLKIAIVQPLLEQEDKLKHPEFTKLYTTYLVEKASKLSTVVFLPETALPESESAKDFAKAFNRNILFFGKVELVYDFKNYNLYAQNTVYYAKFGVIYDKYVKRILVPFGEYTPKGFQFLERFIPYLGNIDYKPGRFLKTFDLFGLKIEPKICNEVFYPFKPIGDTVAVFSNDAWFWKSFSMYNLAVVKAKAIETRKVFIFVNNSGFSGIVYPDGSYKGNPTAKVQVLEF